MQDYKSDDYKYHHSFLLERYPIDKALFTVARRSEEIIILKALVKWYVMIN